MYLGIDGGGSKTAFVLIDASGQVLASHEAGSLYYLEIGLDGVRAVLRAGLAAVLGAAGLVAGDLHQVFIGIPALGEDSTLQAELEALPGSILGATPYACGNDMVCGWAGSLAAADGISIVAGTGSIAYGQWRGLQARAGGWGELFSDEGSAYWIAREGLNLFSRMSDGRAAPGPLLALWRQRLGLASDLDLCARVNDPNAAGRRSVASFAPLVAEAAEAGDEQARAIFGAAAGQLAGIVAATARRLGLGGAGESGPAFPVSYSGGVFQSRDLLLAPFRAALAQALPAAELVSPRLSPVHGAVLLAARHAGAPLGELALQALARGSVQAGGSAPFRP